MKAIQTTVYQADDGTKFETAEEAELHELGIELRRIIIPEMPFVEDWNCTAMTGPEVAAFIVKHREALRIMLYTESEKAELNQLVEESVKSTCECGFEAADGIQAVVGYLLTGEEGS